MSSSRQNVVVAQQKSTSCNNVQCSTLVDQQKLNDVEPCIIGFTLEKSLNLYLKNQDKQYCSDSLIELLNFNSKVNQQQ